MASKAPKNGPVVLTHRAVEALQSAADAYRVSDLRCPGLGLRIAPSGLKTWDVAFRIRGTSTVKRKALGAFPAVGLDDARKRAGTLTAAAQAGRDLLAEEAQAKAVLASRMTVAELIDEYYARACQKLRTKSEIKSRLKRSLGSIAKLSAEDVRRRDLRKIFDAASDRGVAREAEKQRQSVGAMFAWAVAQDIVPDNPVRGLKPYSSGELRERVLSPEEIKLFWVWLSTLDLTPNMADALRLQLCFGSRIGEAAGIDVSEIDQSEWLWTLPAARSKNKKARVTPIVGIARQILEARLQRTKRGPLFTNDAGSILRSNDIGAALITRRKRMPLDHFVSHDLRRTVATELVELGITLDLIAAVLGHEAGDKSTRVLTRHYIRSDLIPQKRLALEAWDARLSAIVEGRASASNVVSLAQIMRPTG